MPSQRLLVALSGALALTGAGEAQSLDDTSVTGPRKIVERDDPLHERAGCFSASGCRAQVSAVGTPSVTQPSGFVVTATNVEGDKDGSFFYGQAGRQATPWGHGTSVRCVASPVKRGGLIQGVGTPGQCDNAYSQNLDARWCPTCTHPGHTPTTGLKMVDVCP